jgi:hypothetical protein
MVSRLLRQLSRTSSPRPRSTWPRSCISVGLCVQSPIFSTNHRLLMRVIPSTRSLWIPRPRW